MTLSVRLLSVGRLSRKGRVTTGLGQRRLTYSKLEIYLFDSLNILRLLLFVLLFHPFSFSQKDPKILRKGIKESLRLVRPL